MVCHGNIFNSYFDCQLYFLMDIGSEKSCCSCLKKAILYVDIWKFRKETEGIGIRPVSIKQNFLQRNECNYSTSNPTILVIGIVDSFVSYERDCYGEKLFSLFLFRNNWNGMFSFIKFCRSFSCT